TGGREAWYRSPFWRRWAVKNWPCTCAPAAIRGLIRTKSRRCCSTWQCTRAFLPPITRLLWQSKKSMGEHLYQKNQVRRRPVRRTYEQYYHRRDRARGPRGLSTVPVRGVSIHATPCPDTSAH